MSKNFPIHERPESSAEALVRMVELEKIKPELYNTLIAQDFFTKCCSLPTVSYYYYLSKILQAYAPHEIKTLALNAENKFSPPPRTADVAIVTVIPEELLAAKIALSIDPNTNENEYSNGLRFWETSLLCKGDKEIRVILTMVGEARTMPCAIACSRLFHVYAVNCSILVGVAAGLKGKVDLGDVIASDHVIDYEGQRLDPTGPKKRPTTYTPPPQIRRDLMYFSDREAWHRHLKESMITLKQNNIPTPHHSQEWIPKFDNGVILAGEKLLANGSLPHLQEEYHDKTRAAEMEGSGFARACQEYDIPWLVFRGISDFGDDNNEATRKEWKSTAAMSAATCVVDFLRNTYRQKNEIEF